MTIFQITWKKPNSEVIASPFNLELGSANQNVPKSNDDI